MNYPANICLEAMRRIFRQQPPRSLLAIGGDSDWLGEALPAGADAALQQIDSAPSLADLAALGAHDAVFITHTLEHLDHVQAEQLIGALRDRFAKRLFVLVPRGADWPGHASTWTLTDMVALGLRQLAAFEHAGRGLALYRFDLYDYKPTPDWLNPRYWANPEMWDKARW